MVARSKLSIDGIDVRAAQVFLASNLEEDELAAEGLVGLLPDRRWKRGNRPGRTTTELSSKRPDPESEEAMEYDHQTKWAPTDTSRLSISQRRHLVAKACQIAVLRIFENHHYQFEGQTYCQSLGAPIGRCLTLVVAIIVMDEWMSEFLVRLSDGGVDLLALTKYVDDLNIVAMLLNYGSRWEAGKVIHCEEQEKKDHALGKSRDRITMEVIQDAANSILPWIQLTLDTPEMHDHRHGPCPGPPGLGQETPG